MAPDRAVTPAASASEPLVTPAEVLALARVAGLTVDPQRRPALARELDGLLVDADRVNRFMDGRTDVRPSVRFDFGARGERA